jgi:t-SNARE complex subunit (syntaxin)
MKSSLTTGLFSVAPSHPTSCWSAREGTKGRLDISWVSKPLVVRSITLRVKIIMAYYGGNPYGSSSARVLPHHTTSTPYANTTTPSMSNMLSSLDCLTRTEGVRNDIDRLESNIIQIASFHERALSASDDSPGSALENTKTLTQALIANMESSIRILEIQVSRSNEDAARAGQVRCLRFQFRAKLEQYRQEEILHMKRYQDRIKRRYRTVHPQADDGEVAEAMADWDNKGACPAVQRCRMDLQRIEETAEELGQLIKYLDGKVKLQEPVEIKLSVGRSTADKDNNAANPHLNVVALPAHPARKWVWAHLGLGCLFLLAGVAALTVCIEIVSPPQGK